MKGVIVHPSADREFRKAMRWYDKRRPGLGRALRTRIEEALDKIAADPEAGIVYRVVFRFIRVKQFPYVIYYCEFKEHLWIAAIAHSRQRPDYWSRRKPT